MYHVPYLYMYMLSTKQAVPDAAIVIFCVLYSNQVILVNMIINSQVLKTIHSWLITQYTYLIHLSETACPFQLLFIIKP